MQNMQKKLIPAMCKCMVSMATHNVIFKNGGVTVTTKLFIPHLLVSLDYKTYNNNNNNNNKDFISRG